ncbi:MAG: orotate phosphoribosyltransferase [Alphaproteobacteria bacterium]|nr:orotate phosphoribosyltransferase [Alphaproteobacteria bacterium]
MNKDFAHKTAQILIETKSVLFNAEQPFIFRSGRKSPVYVDCRRLISFAEERSILMDMAAETLKDLPVDCFAGGETAGIAYAALIAERLNKPMVYVRKEPKGYGRQAQIEGALTEDKKPRTILVEDLQTDGGSKKTFIDALRKADCVVDHTFVIFHYGIYPQSLETMKSLGVSLNALADWWEVLETAKKGNYFDTKTLGVVENYLNAPESWAA